MSVTELAGKILSPDSPWFLVVAAGILAAAAAIGRRLWASLRRIGERVGKLETELVSERTRRQQVECVLLEDGIPLPVWPGDPANLRELAVLRRRVAILARDDEDQDDDYRAGPLTSLADEAPLPPVPPASRPVARHGSR